MSVEHDPAFPFVTHGGIHEHQHFAPGLTKRELFAAMAMQGLAVHWIESWAREVVADRFDKDNPTTAPQDLARWSVCAADALLAALSAPQEPSNAR